MIPFWATKKNQFPRTIEAWSNIIHPEDRERVEKKLQEHHKRRIKWDEKYRVIRKDGKISWWVDRGETRWDQNGNPLVMTGVIVDITEKVLQEKKLFEFEKQKNIKSMERKIFSICLINCQSVFIYRKMTTLSPLLIKCSKNGLGFQKKASVMS